MYKLHNQDEYGTQQKPEGGLQASLCSNNVPTCSSPSGFNNFISEDDALDYLAEVLVETFLDHKKEYAIESKEESGHLRPSVNKRTG